MDIDISVISGQADPLEVSGLVPPQGAEIRAVREIWRDSWEFDYEELVCSWQIAMTCPDVRSRLQPNFGPDTILESIALHHAAVRWGDMFTTTLEELKVQRRSEDCLGSTLNITYLAAPWSQQSNWISGFSLREIDTASVDDLTPRWNQSVGRFEERLEHIRSVEELEQILAQTTESLMRLTLIRLANIKYAHLDVLHKTDIGYEDPFHSALHMLEHGPVGVARVMMDGLTRLTGRYEAHSFPYVLDTEFFREFQERRGAVRDDPEEALAEWRTYALRELIYESLRGSSTQPGLLENEGVFELYNRRY